MMECFLLDASIMTMGVFNSSLRKLIARRNLKMLQNKIKQYEEYSEQNHDWLMKNDSIYKGRPIANQYQRYKNEFLKQERFN